MSRLVKATAIIRQVPPSIWAWTAVILIILLFVWTYNRHQRTLGELKEAHRTAEAVVEIQNLAIKNYQREISKLQASLTEGVKERIVYKTRLQKVEVEGEQKIKEVSSLTDAALWNAVGQHPRIRTPQDN